MFSGPDTSQIAMNSAFSTSQRVEPARKAVAAHPKCGWIGFDSKLHQQMEGNTGRPKSEHWAPVNC